LQEELAEALLEHHVNFSRSWLE